MKRITVAKGDGIGPEIMDATLSILMAAGAKIEIDEIEIALSGQIDNIFVFLGTEQTGYSGFKDISGTLYVTSSADEEILDELWRETLAASPVMNTLTHNATMNISLRVI